MTRNSIDRRSFIAAATTTAGLGLLGKGARAATDAATSAGAGKSAARKVTKDASDFIADFACGLSYSDLSGEIVQDARNGLLDSIGCTVGALGEPDLSIVRKSILTRPDAPCTLVGSKGRASAPDAAMLNTSMTRHLDLLNTYAGPRGGAHPANSVCPIIACAELSGASGKEVLLSIVVATEVLGAFADVVNSREKSGIEHLGYDAIAMTAGAGKALRLTPPQMKQAVSLTAASYNPLQVTRADQITMWKNFSAGYAALVAVNSAILAGNGMQGPNNTFDGRTGWKEVVAREDFDLKFTRGERIRQVLFKLYLAETYALSAAEAATKLGRQNHIAADQIQRVDVRSFSGAVSRLGANGNRDPYNVTSKPEADHSLPYIVAVGLIDGKMGKEQYAPERLVKPDVQSVLKKVHLTVDEAFEKRSADRARPFPVAIDVTMTDGRHYKIAQDYFSGHPMQPATQEQLLQKFRDLTAPFMPASRQARLVETIESFETHGIADLTRLLASA